MRLAAPVPSANLFFSGYGQENFTIFVSMRRILLVAAVLLPLCAHAYSDHRGRNIDSLEAVTARFTPDRLAKASVQEKTDYALACRDLAWAYLQLDGAKCIYYARQATAIAQELDAPNTIFDMSILTGQVYWARDQFDSARVYYDRAAHALTQVQERWTKPDTHDLEAMQSRLWGTLGNFYAMQDSVEQFTYYYNKAGEIFEKWEWWEDCSVLHRNLGEIYLDYDDLAAARPEYEQALRFALMSGDSLMIAGANYGMGRWHKAKGHTARALKYLTEADKYYGDHAREESVGRADTLQVMSDSYKLMSRNGRIIAVILAVLLLSLAVIVLVMRRMRRIGRTLSETSAVLDETIEELRPEAGGPAQQIHLTKREMDIARLLMEGQPTKQIAANLGIGDETVLWYRKRLYAKLNVHSAAAFTSEMHRLHLT